MVWFLSAGLSATSLLAWRGGVRMTQDSPFKVLSLLGVALDGDCAMSGALQEPPLVLGIDRCNLHSN